MSNRPVYVMGAFLLVVQIGSAAYFAGHRPKPLEVMGPSVFLVDAVPQVEWDGSAMRIDFANVTGTSGAVDETSFAVRVTLTKPAAETLFRSLAQIHGARPAPTPEPNRSQF